MHPSDHRSTMHSSQDTETSCPLMNEWIKKMWHIHTMACYSALKNEIMPFSATWMDLQGIMPSEMSDIESLIYGIYKKKQAHKYREQIDRLGREKNGGRRSKVERKKTIPYNIHSTI